MPSNNIPIYSVSEISLNVKKTIEESFSHVRIRGEVSTLKKASSGHVYLSLKDEKAVINSIIWKGVASKIPFSMEEGLEIIAQGKLSSYPGRSNYQLIIESAEIAGEGALLKLLEDRKRKLQKEGLFDPQHKKPLPYLPKVIGLVTSPTGAVLHDIIHRISARFGVRLILNPVAVQGDGASSQIARAISQFDSLPFKDIPKPDLLIVARGGGSLEDLWCFNEEEVARAVFKCSIPIISAVGHETDTTLIDYVSDLRTPTPTGAAEMAVPVKNDLMANILDISARLERSKGVYFKHKHDNIINLKRALKSPKDIIENNSQKLDDRVERFELSVKEFLNKRSQYVENLKAKLISPQSTIAIETAKLNEKANRLEQSSKQLINNHRQNVISIANQIISPKNILGSSQNKLDYAMKTLEFTTKNILDNKKKNIEPLARLLETLSYENTLKRGFTITLNDHDEVVTSADNLSENFKVKFHDGEIYANRIKKSVDTQRENLTDQQLTSKKAKSTQVKNIKSKSEEQEPRLF